VRLSYQWQCEGGACVSPPADSATETFVFGEPGTKSIRVAVHGVITDNQGLPLHSADCSTESIVPIFQLQCTVAPDGEMWWFNGATPPGWPTEARLTASGPTSGDFIWTVTSGTACVQFENGQDAYVGHDDNSVVVEATGPSAAESDVTIKFRYVHGQIAEDVDEYKLTVRMPAGQGQYAPPDYDPSPKRPYGYLTRIHYYMVDNLGDAVGDEQTELPGNEEWTTPQVDVWQPQLGWDRPEDPPGSGGFIATGMYPPTYEDWIHVGTYGGMDPMPYYSPPGQLGNELVDHWGQKWNWGTLTIGQGAPTQDKTLYRYRDHGDVR